MAAGDWGAAAAALQVQAAERDGVSLPHVDEQLLAAAVEGSATGRAAAEQAVVASAAEAAAAEAEAAREEAELAAALVASRFLAEEAAAAAALEGGGWESVTASLGEGGVPYCYSSAPGRAAPAPAGKAAAGLEAQEEEEEEAALAAAIKASLEEAQRQQQQQGGDATAAGQAAAPPVLPPLAPARGPLHVAPAAGCDGGGSSGLGPLSLADFASGSPGERSFWGAVGLAQGGAAAAAPALAASAGGESAQPTPVSGATPAPSEGWPAPSEQAYSDGYAAGLAAGAAVLLQPAVRGGAAAAGGGGGGALVAAGSYEDGEADEMRELLKLLGVG